MAPERPGAWRRRRGVLASRRRAWQTRAMVAPSSPPGTSPPAGGALIALGCVAGAAIGFFARQPTIGFLIGLGLGVAASLLIWRRGRG